jgi:nucleotide-binding universal stress UspA family protein
VHPVRGREEVEVGYLVVGVDGSEQARRALHWALDEAGYRGLELRVVLVYAPGDETSPYVRSYAFTPEAVAVERLAGDEQRLREERATEARLQAERLVQAELDRVRRSRTAGTDPADGGPRQAGGQVTTHVVADERPVRALIHFAERADGLVVGSRGRGGFAGLLLGSVSQQLAQHAPCPVTIVPTPRS